MLRCIFLFGNLWCHIKHFCCNCAWWLSWLTDMCCHGQSWRQPNCVRKRWTQQVLSWCPTELASIQTSKTLSTALSLNLNQMYPIPGIAFIQDEGEREQCSKFCRGCLFILLKQAVMDSEDCLIGKIYCWLCWGWEWGTWVFTCFAS